VPPSFPSNKKVLGASSEEIRVGKSDSQRGGKLQSVFGILLILTFYYSAGSHHLPEVDVKKGNFRERKGRETGVRHLHASTGDLSKICDQQSRR